MSLPDRPPAGVPPVNPILALSTAWCSARHTDGYAMLQEMADLGFKHVELSHGIRITLVPGILKALQEGVIKVSSLHNFCPLPAGMMHAAPNLFEPSAPANHGHEHEQCPRCAACGCRWKFWVFSETLSSRIRRSDSSNRNRFLRCSHLFHNLWRLG